MGEKNNDKIMEREVQLFCRVRNFPYEDYGSLSDNNKIIFKKLTCQQNNITTTKQREDLFGALQSSNSYRSGKDLRELVLAEGRKKYFSLLTPEERYNYFSKF